jgi:hypothetical protein
VLYRVWDLVRPLGELPAVRKRGTVGQWQPNILTCCAWESAGDQEGRLDWKSLAYISFAKLTLKYYL